MRRLSCCLIVISLAIAMPSAARANVKLPKVIDSHMVLQRDRPLPIWGWADPGEVVTVTLDAATATATADAKSQWNVFLPPVAADGKTHRMTVAGHNKIELEDILIGDVWLGSGQSNMEMGITMCNKAKEQIAAANQPQIRLLLVPKTMSPKPAQDVKSEWVHCTPETIVAGGWGGFSAALYYFGLKLQKELNVPIGLIESAWGGSPIEQWILPGDKTGGMYNGMIAPLEPFAICGAIWYQGENNVSQGLKYADKMRALIEGWRHVWGYNFPFYYVQIAPWSGYQQASLPDLWEAQVASLKIPGTGMAVTTDLVDNIKDVHPHEKIEVGSRLARWGWPSSTRKTLSTRARYTSRCTSKATRFAFRLHTRAV